MIPIYILGGLKSIPLMPHVCIYIYNGSYPPPHPWLPTPPQGSGVVGIPGIIYLPTPPPGTGAPYTGKSEGMGLAVLRYLYLFCRTARSIFSRVGRPLPGGKVHTQDSSYPWTLWTPQTNLDVIGLRSVAFVPVSIYLKWYTFIKTVNAKSVASLDVTR